MKNDPVILGGVNISGGQGGRKGLFLPTKPEVTEWESFLTKNDTVQPAFVALDEMAPETAPTEMIMPTTIDDIPLLINEVDNVSEAQLAAAASAILEDHDMLIALYEHAFSDSFWTWAKEKDEAQRKLLNLVLHIVGAMVRIESAGNITRALALRSLHGTTLLGWFVRDARVAQDKDEPLDVTRARRCATAILNILDHPDPFARYLD